eukprot:746165-Rhodomonas_salina.3
MSNASALTDRARSGSPSCTSSSVPCPTFLCEPAPSRRCLRRGLKETSLFRHASTPVPKSHRSDSAPAASESLWWLEWVQTREHEDGASAKGTGCTWSRTVLGALKISRSPTILLTFGRSCMQTSFMAAMEKECSSISDVTSGSTKQATSRASLGSTGSQNLRVTAWYLPTRHDSNSVTPSLISLYFCLQSSAVRSCRPPAIRSHSSSESGSTMLLIDSISQALHDPGSLPTVYSLIKSCIADPALESELMPVEYWKSEPPAFFLVQDKARLQHRMQHKAQQLHFKLQHSAASFSLSKCAFRTRSNWSA